MPNPNSLTPARIPNAVIDATTNPTNGSDYNQLCRNSFNNKCNIRLGTKKSYQPYSVTLNAGEDPWRNGLSPGDDGRNNDGIFNPSVANATSKFSGQSHPFEWWDKYPGYTQSYVVYWLGGVGGVGSLPENLECRVFRGSQICDFANTFRTTGFPLITDEFEAVNYFNGASPDGDALSNYYDYLVVNTNYPDIPIYIPSTPATDGKTMSYLLDTGFLPSYCRKSANNGNPGQMHNICSLSVTDDAIVQSSSGPNGIYYNFPATASCNGGAMYMGSAGWVEVPYSGDINVPSFTSAVWVYMDGNLGSWITKPIITNTDNVGNRGWKLETDAGKVPRFSVYDGNLNAFRSLSGTTISENKWEYIMVSYDDNTGVLKMFQANIGTTTVSESSATFSMSHVVNGIKLPLTILFDRVLSVYAPYSSFSVFAHWQGAFNRTESQSFFDAYQMSSFERGSKFQSSSLGRYWT